MGARFGWYVEPENIRDRISAAFPKVSARKKIQVRHTKWKVKTTETTRSTK